MKKFDCLIIGLGKIGLIYDLNKKAKFLTHVKSINYHQNFRLKGVIDSDVKKKKNSLKIIMIVQLIVQLKKWHL